MSITNNEVKFLVSLDIDKDKSKKRIDTFLSKEMKDKKLTFGVNVGASNKNIKTFLDKHKNKNINLSFDVAVGQSKANIQTFLNNQKQAKKSLIFYVNEQATQTTVKSALKKIEVQPLQISFGVNYQQSKANINEFIETVKVNQKPIELILEKKASVENINKSLEKIIFAKAKVKLELAKGAFNHIKDTVETKELQGLKTVMELDVEKTKLRISEQINKMSLPKFKIDVVANVTPVVSSETVQATVKEAPSHVKEIPSPPTDFNETIGALKELRSILIDINTKMTDLKKNTSEDTSLGKQVSDYSAKAIEFGQTISSIAEASDAASNSTSKFSKGANMLSNALGAVGVVGSIAGAAIQFVTARYEEAQKAKEELIAKNEQEVKSFADNEKAIDSLLSKYSTLSAESKGQQLDSQKYKELLDTQNELGKLLPNLVKGEDEYGNKILVSSMQAETKVDILKQELEVQKLLNAEKGKKEQEEAEETARDTIKGANRDTELNLESAYAYVHKMELVSHNYDELKDKLTKGIGINEDLWSGNSLKSIDDVALAIERVKEALAKKTELNLGEGAIFDLESSQKHLEQIYFELLQSQKDVMSGLNVLKTGYTKDLEDTIKLTGDFSTEGQEVFEDVANSVINLAETESDLDDFNEAITMALGKKDADIEKNFTELADTISEMKKSGITDVDEFEKKYGESFNTIKGSILKALKDSGIKEGTALYETYENTLDNFIESKLNEEKAIKEIMETQGKGRKEAEEYFKTHNEGAEGLADVIDPLVEYAQKIKSFSSLGEEMLGVTGKQISETNELTGIYKYLSSVTNKTTDEQAKLEDAMKKLKALYPHLVKNGEIRIESIEAENKMNKILTESYKNLTDGKYNSEEEQTYYSAVGAKARVENLQVELEALEKAKNFHEKNALLMSGFSGVAGLAMKATAIAYQSRYDTTKAKLDQELAKLNTGINSLSTSNDKYSKSSDKASESTDNYSKSSDKASESTKDAKKELSELEKITNKYTLTLDKLNTSLKEVESRQKKYPTYSKQYRQALADENKLLQQQNDIYNQKLKDLNGVTNSSSTTVSGTGGTVRPKGWSGQITSQYGTRSDNHRGTDIDGKIGDVLESNINGKVLKAGDATKIGEDKSYGNLVIIQDANNNKHYYAHMNDVSVVKGQQITAGTKLGTIGNTGTVRSGSGGDGSHLHYEIRNSSNQTINPSSYIASARQGVTSGGSSKANGNSTQATVWNFFKSKGLSDSAVAGIMGNIQQESSFSSTAGKNAQGSAFGIAQWRGSRLSELNSFAKSKGTSANDLGTQLDFMWKELQGKEKQALHSLNRTLTATEHASNFNTLYERSGEKAGSKGHNNRVNYANNAYNTYAGSGATAGSGSGDDDYARVHSESQSMIQAIMANNDKISENNFNTIKSQMDAYKRNRDMEDNAIAKQAELQKNMLEYSKAYEDSVNKQYTAEQRKLKSYQAEYAYIQKMYDAGGLDLNQQDQLLDRRYELQQVMLQSQNQIKAYYNEIISSKLSKFDYHMEKHQKVLEWEEVKIQSLDNTSERYRKTLEIMANTRKSQLTTAKQEIDYINQMLSKGNLTIEMYEELTSRAGELKKELVELNEAFHQLNYEKVQAVATSHDIKIDDIDFELSYNQSLRGLLDEGSGDYLKTLESDMELYQKKLIEIAQKEIDMKAEMQGLDLGSQKLQDLEEQLEELALSYLDVQNAVKDTQDAIDNFAKAVDDKVEEMRNKLAEDIINALKDAYREAKDIQLSAIDKLIEAEEERHEKVMKQYDKELEAYTKIIDAKRREIQDADRDRTYGNKLDELNTQKQELQNKLNLLSNVNTYEGIKEKEELQKQIAEIEKQINEEKYQYEKGLREQQLDDMLDDKTEHIEDLKDKEDEYSKEVLDSLNKQKKYWEKHYEDLLNDEAKFNELREEMAQGHYGKVQELYNKYIGELKASLPDLEDRFDGTWEAVGTSIRENVINEMERLLKEIEKVEEEIEKVQNLAKNVTGEHDFSTDANQTVENAGKTDPLTEADMKVILAKFMNEKIAGSLDPKKDAVRIKNIKDKADKLAKEGRAEGSKYNANQSLGSIFDSMSSSQISELGSYFQNNSDASGFMTQEYLDYIKEFGQTASKGKVMTHGDKQVMLAKYMKEYLMPLANTKAKKDALNGTATKIADSGRMHTSLISPTVSYEQSLSKLSGKQQAELGQYMLDNSTVVSFDDLKNKLINYADNLRRNASNDFVGADTGGMTTGFGSTGGTDGKGGRLALLHQNELVSNPLDTERMLRISSIMDNVMRTINGVIALPASPKVNSVSTPTETEKSTVVNINIDKFNGTKNDIDYLAKQIQNRLLREKGKR
ncbi:Murein DD-endopeptidase MepM and murein hydrolase activator NlpD, contain LysM domain [Lysinibacillus sp. AC-3]|uniref:phage tail tip lysozyme n=1 Tax=unclassified Lysinibacillus TaxID=2636778 RepID=UPI0009D4418D|nr:MULTISPECIES: phage tail tip lysozyme [unclassified Lysinibacillus]SKB63932.1 Murein DD-endopeptidase MepM and murein hydrolase activator NlpD, contain LysM domain [Lysinibacillus sp. AC-3]